VAVSLGELTPSKIAPQRLALGRPAPGRWNGDSTRGRAWQTPHKTITAKPERTMSGGITVAITDRGIGEVTGAIANRKIGMAPGTGYPTFGKTVCVATWPPTQLRSRQDVAGMKTTVLSPETGIRCEMTEEA
jgi:hypothetical protein